MEPYLSNKRFFLILSIIGGSFFGICYFTNQYKKEQDIKYEKKDTIPDTKKIYKMNFNMPEKQK